jgi:hypothetical protein
MSDDYSDRAWHDEASVFEPLSLAGRGAGVRGRGLPRSSSETKPEWDGSACFAHSNPRIKSGAGSLPKGESEPSFGTRGSLSLAGESELSQGAW